MEDNLNFLVNWRQPQPFFLNGRWTQYFCIWKTTSIHFVNGRMPHMFFLVKDDLFFRWRTTSSFGKWKQKMNRVWVALQKQPLKSFTCPCLGVEWSWEVKTRSACFCFSGYKMSQFETNLFFFLPFFLSDWL